MQKSAEAAQTFLVGFGWILLDSFIFFLQKYGMMNSIRSASIESIVKAKGVPLELHIVGVGCQVQIELHIADMLQTCCRHVADRSIFFSILTVASDSRLTRGDPHQVGKILQLKIHPQRSLT